MSSSKRTQDSMTLGGTPDRSERSEKKVKFEENKGKEATKVKGENEELAASVGQDGVSSDVDKALQKYKEHFQSQHDKLIKVSKKLKLAISEARAEVKEWDSRITKEEHEVLRRKEELGSAKADVWVSNFFKRHAESKLNEAEGALASHCRKVEDLIEMQETTEAESMKLLK